jgi:hypothetical protein
MLYLLSTIGSQFFLSTPVGEAPERKKYTAPHLKKHNSRW